ITIDCSETLAGVLAALTNGINVNGAGVDVILRGLDIEGVGTGLIGINFIVGNSLQVEHCNVFGFQSGTAQGIRFVPNAAAKLFIRDTTVSLNGTGVFVGPSASTSLVTLERVNLNKNTEGFRATGSSGGHVFANIQDSLS